MQQHGMLYCPIWWGSCTKLHNLHCWQDRIFRTLLKAQQVLLSEHAMLPSGSMYSLLVASARHSVTRAELQRQQLQRFSIFGPEPNFLLPLRPEPRICVLGPRIAAIACSLFCPSDWGGGRAEESSAGLRGSRRRRDDARPEGGI